MSDMMMVMISIFSCLQACVFVRALLGVLLPLPLLLLLLLLLLHPTP
jgi:hypothetical protein